MTHIYRCILDTKEDVIRDIKIHSGSSLEQLHTAIVKAFNLPAGELASFYEVDDNWTQLQEIPLLNMGMEEDLKTMREFPLNKVFSQINDKMLYVYDFLNYWTFYITLIKTETSTDNTEEPSIIFSKGTVPGNAPERHFETQTDTQNDNTDEDFDLGYGDLFDEDFDMDGFTEY
jgi:hypothetical protein